MTDAVKASEKASGETLAETFLVVVDETEECAKAIRFAALRAQHTGARVALLHVLNPTQFLQWGGVQQDMDAEAEQKGQALLASKAGEVEALTGDRPALRLARGRATEAVLAVVTADRSIRALVLAAAAKGRPGPLVDFFSGERAGTLPCMVMIVPGGIADEALDRLT
jgi:nucleotide-binding universal stress UspA family protein